MPGQREVWWLVALEAAVFFSVPTWALTGRGWPREDPLPFSLAVVAGATAAWLVCHVLPTLGAGWLTEKTDSRLMGVARRALRGWFCVGAALALGQLAQGGSAQVLSYMDFLGERPAWRPAAGLGLMVLFAVIPLVLARRVRWQRLVVAVSLGFCVAMVGSSVVANWSGRSAHMSASGIDRPMDVLRGMLMAAAPASVVAMRLGRMGLTPRRVCWTGLWGVWLPLAASVAAINVAKMWGAQLYWRPSVPIEFYFAFAWLFQGEGGRGGTAMAEWWLWPALSITMVATGVVCAMWLEETTPGWRWWWRGMLAVGGLWLARVGTVSGWMKTAYGVWWVWSIVAVFLAVAVWQAWIRIRGRGRWSRGGVR